MSGRVIVLRGDAAHLPLPDGSVDAVVTDPPYGLAELPTAMVTKAITAWLAGDREHVPNGPGGFMGREWDRFVPPPAAWDECLRVLKPGGHLLAFAGSRTQDLMGLSIRLAGFEIRDSIPWIFGQGMPKSLDVSKAIDKTRHDKPAMLAVAEWLRERIEASGITRRAIAERFGIDPRGVDLWAPNPADNSARQRVHTPTWEQWLGLQGMLGFGGDVDAEVWRLNGRKGEPGEAWEQREITQAGVGKHTPGDVISWDQRASGDRERRDIPATREAARWEGWGTGLKPANEPVIMARKSFAGTVAGNVLTHGTGALNIAACQVGTEPRVNNAGGASSLQRVSRVEQGYRPSVTTSRNEASEVAGRWPTNVVLSHAPECGDRCVAGCPVAELDAQSGVLKGAVSNGKKSGTGYHGNFGAQQQPPGFGDEGGASRFFPVFRYEAKADAASRPRLPDGTAWPTVKPVPLLRWMARLVCRPGGTILDPFCGTGSLGEAAIIEGFDAILLDKDPQAIALTRVRLAKPMQPVMFAPEPAAERSVPKPPPPVPGSLFDLGEAS